MPARRNRLLLGLAFATSFVAANAHSAQLVRTAIVAPGLMSSACAGLTNGANSGPGGLVGTGFPAELTCNSQQSVGPTAAGAAGYVNSAQAISASSLAYSTWGAVRLATDFSGPNNTVFPQANANAGWVDGWRVDPVNPAFIGQSAILSFRIRVEADLFAFAGFNVFARLVVQPYVNDSSFAVPTDFRVQGQGFAGAPYQQTVATTASFEIPIVLGTPFEFSFFARATSGTGSQAGSTSINTAGSDAASIDWDGITGVTVGGQPVDVVLTADSGVDWTVPVPEPTTALAVPFGAVGLAALARRRRG